MVSLNRPIFIISICISFSPPTTSKICVCLSGCFEFRHAKWDLDRLAASLSPLHSCLPLSFALRASRFALCTSHVSNPNGHVTFGEMYMFHVSLPASLLASLALLRTPLHFSPLSSLLASHSLRTRSCRSISLELALHSLCTRFALASLLSQGSLMTSLDSSDPTLTTPR